MPLYIAKETCVIALKMLDGLHIVRAVVRIAASALPLCALRPFA
jgi:hypothetical protein